MVELVCDGEGTFRKRIDGWANNDGKLARVVVRQCSWETDFVRHRGYGIRWYGDIAWPWKSEKVSGDG